MNLINIKTKEEMELYWDERRKLYYFDGNLQLECAISVSGALIVRGYIKADDFIVAGDSIEAGGAIKAGTFIKADGGIEAGTFIKAGDFIEAGRAIVAGTFIEAGDSIEAGEYIKAGSYVYSFFFHVLAKTISTRTLPFGRNFYAQMPPLRKFADEILEVSNCWDDLSNLPTEEEKEEIVNWDGWHWILRGQLECFLGLKESFMPPE